MDNIEAYWWINKTIEKRVNKLNNNFEKVVRFSRTAFLFNKYIHKQFILD